jgi:hypothetical protein
VPLEDTQRTIAKDDAPLAQRSTADMGGEKPRQKLFESLWQKLFVNNRAVCFFKYLYITLSAGRPEGG